MVMPKDPVKAEATRKKMSESAKKRFEDPEERKKNSEAQKKSHGTPESRKKASVSGKKRFEVPGAKEKHGEILKKARGTPENRKKNSEAQKKVKGTPEARKENSDAKKKYYKDNPKAKERFVKISKEYFESPGAKEKQSDILKKFYMDQWWYGSVKYYDGLIYCEKWTPDLRERVRAFFNYTRVECGIPQNGKKLSVHHVWYNKKLCCDDTPRLLVPLCHPCHMKTSVVKGKKREEFSIHFQEIIDTQYDGRCRMSKEEFAEFKKNN